MKITELTRNDIMDCVKLIIRAYNGRPWNYLWTPEKANLYLNELLDSTRFTGFCIYEDDQLVAAMFAHLKTWWISDLLIIDELFVSPDKQGKGYGQCLMDSAEQFCERNNISGINLITNKYMPAISFYEKNKFHQAAQYLLMFKDLDGKL